MTFGADHPTSRQSDGTRTASCKTSAAATEGRCCSIASVSPGTERTRVHPQLMSAPFSPKASAPRVVSGRKIRSVEYSTAGAVALTPRCTTTATLTKDTARMTSWSSQNHELVHGEETERATDSCVVPESWDRIRSHVDELERRTSVRGWRSRRRAETVHARHPVCPDESVRPAEPVENSPWLSA